MKPQIVVTSSSPMPRFRAGTSFSGAQAFALNHFSAEQLKEIVADRLLTAVVGHVIQASEVDALTAHWAAHPELHEAKPAPAEETTGQTQLVGGLSVYPAGSQSAVLPAHGDVAVDDGRVGGVPQPGAPAAGPVIAKTRGHKGG